MEYDKFFGGGGHLRVGIIGTAGRAQDKAILNLALYKQSRLWITHFLATECHPSERTFVSGGAAWMDHLAVTLFKMDQAAYLELHLPARWDPTNVCFSETTRDGKTANYYHRLFSEKVNGDSLRGLHEVMQMDNVTTKFYPGFHPRNLEVGKVNMLLALTTQAGDVPRDGGTKHTWDHSPAERKYHHNVLDTTGF